MYLGTIYISYMKLVQSNVEDLSVGQHRITRFTISIYSGNNVFGYLSLLTRGTITVIKQQQNPYIANAYFRGSNLCSAINMHHRVALTAPRSVLPSLVDN